jgi:isocitrate lyase
MKAYVELIQRKERDIGCDVLTHQKVSLLFHLSIRLSRFPTPPAPYMPPLMSSPQWSGAEYIDQLLMTVTGGVSSTAAMGKGVTESQFSAPPEVQAKSKL